MLTLLLPISLRLCQPWNKPKKLKKKMYKEPNDAAVTVVAVLLTTILSLTMRMGTVFLGTMVAVWTLRWMGVAL
jgi:hypothetical protein